MPISKVDDDSVRGHAVESFAGSALFERTFEEGMSLVEETARYLEGPGRQESRDLPRAAALLYAGESLRVTTRLMQAASWLLVQRAVHEGDMRAEDAEDERYRLGSKEICLGGRGANVEALPRTLQTLLARSESLYRRVVRLETILIGRAEPAHGARLHFERLERAFGEIGAAESANQPLT
jgi:regulator of CtrA degradation